MPNFRPATVIEVKEAGSTIVEAGKKLNFVGATVTQDPGDPTQANIVISGDGNSASFDFEDSGQIPIYTAPPGGKVIIAVELYVSETFDDVAATAEVGTNAVPDLLMTNADLDLNSIGDYENNPVIEVAGGETVYLTLSPGTSSQGKGGVIVRPGV